jgi:transglutaminase-like putative cysteine protease
MQIRVGYELIYECPRPTPMLLTLNIHYSRASDVVVADHIITNPPRPISAYRDGFGNWCSRIVAPPGQIRIATDALVNDSGLPDEVHPYLAQHAVEDLPADTLVYLLGSRYCETDRLSETAWSLFGTDAARLAAGAGHL